MLVIQKFPDNMKNAAVDFQHPNRTLFNGAFAEHVVVNGAKREFITYIPEETENCNPCIVVAVPSDNETMSFFEQSGLKKFADEKKIFIHLLSAENGRWNNSGADSDYMNAVYIAIQSRDYYVTMQDNIYACGVGDGVCVAQQAVANMASEWSGAFTWGDFETEINLERPNESHELDQGQGELKVQAEKSPVPIWMVFTNNSKNNQLIIDYWKKQNHVTEDVYAGCGADYIWIPDAVRTKNEINEENIAQVRVSMLKEKISSEMIDTIWNYIGKARRHRGQAKKNLRYYKDPIACGATLRKMNVDGMVRSWYEYVPENCSEKEPLPLVVVMHGRGGSAETFFDLSGMSIVAEERKFVALFPEAGIHQQKKDGLKNILLWNGEYEGNPIDDVKFIREMVKEVESRRKIDRSRIYACGQSSGGMMTDVLCNSASDIFAACACWSALRAPSRMYRTFENSAPSTPTLFLYGDRDFLSAGKKVDPDFPISLDSEMKQQVLEKIEKYHLKISDVQTWESKPITWYCFPDSSGVPMLVIGRVDNMVHANYPEESWISYDQFLCQFTRGEHGELIWRGKEVYK